jgi:hypothetical protein
MIPEVSILDGMDGVWVGMGRYRMDGHPRHTFTGISQAPIRSAAARLTVVRAHGFSLNSSQSESHIKSPKPSNLTLFMKYVKTTTIPTQVNVALLTTKAA